METVAKFVTKPLDAPPSMGSWRELFLAHLEEFTLLAWWLVADGQLVEETFSRATMQLERTPFEEAVPLFAYNQARRVLIAQAIAVLESASCEDEESPACSQVRLEGHPDLPRLAQMLRMVVRSSLGQVASLLDVPPCEAREFVCRAIYHLSGSQALSLPRTCHERRNFLVPADNN